MPENRLRETGTFDFRIVQSNAATSPVEILDVGAIVAAATATIDPRWEWRANFFLENLSASVWLPSFKTAPFPPLYPEDSAAERAAKLMKVESNYPKVGLKILKQRQGETEWRDKAQPILQNRGRRYLVPLINPYLTMGEVKILGLTDKLALALRDYGDGIVGGGAHVPNRIYDLIDVEGEWRLEIDLILMAKRPAATPMSSHTVGPSPVQIAAANPSRAYFEIQNQGAEDILWGFGADGAIATAHPFRIKPGETYFPGNAGGYVPTDAIWAKVESSEAIAVLMESTYT